jgi:hypothetical protein
MNKGENNGHANHTLINKNKNVPHFRLPYWNQAHDFVATVVLRKGYLSYNVR